MTKGKLPVVLENVPVVPLVEKPVAEIVPMFDKFLDESRISVLFTCMLFCIFKKGVSTLLKE